MLMKFTRQMSKYTSVVLILAFVCFIINSSANGHFHKLTNGSKIFHAHPYDKQHDQNSHEKSHHHTNIEFFILELINSAVFIFSVGLVFNPSRIHLKNINTFSYWIIPEKEWSPVFNKRAPPFSNL